MIIRYTERDLRARVRYACISGFPSSLRAVEAPFDAHIYPLGCRIGPTAIRWNSIFSTFGVGGGGPVYLNYYEDTGTLNAQRMSPGNNIHFYTASIFPPAGSTLVSVPPPSLLVPSWLPSFNFKSRGSLVDHSFRIDNWTKNVSSFIASIDFLQLHLWPRLRLQNQTFFRTSTPTRKNNRQRSIMWISSQVIENVSVMFMGRPVIQSTEEKSFKKKLCARNVRDKR